MPHVLVAAERQVQHHVLRQRQVPVGGADLVDEPAHRLDLGRGQAQRRAQAGGHAATLVRGARRYSLTSTGTDSTALATADPVRRRAPELERDRLVGGALPAPSSGATLWRTLPSSPPSAS